MNVLILTDHTLHNASNSLYGIANALYKSNRTYSVFICSRGIEKNKDFFLGKKGAKMHTLKMEHPLDYHSFKRLIESSKYRIPVEMNTLLVRLPRPIHPDLFPMLEKRFQNCAVVNNLEGIQEVSTKAFLTKLTRFTPPVKLCKCWEDIWWFYKKFPIVLKPLKDYGGNGIVKLISGKAYLGNHKQIPIELFEQEYRKNPIEYLAMKYLPNVVNGDKRVIVANGKILGAMLRIPQEGHWLCNASQGGISKPSVVSAREEEIIHYLNPIVKKHKVFMYGVDLLENSENDRVISEVNALSVGGLQPLYDQGQTNIFKQYAEEFTKFIENEYH